jgi:hypothetical protein
MIKDPDLLMNEIVPFQTRCLILWTFFVSARRCFQFLMQEVFEYIKLFVKPFHTNEALLWDIASLWGQMPQSLYFCIYVGREEHAAFAVHVFYPLTVHRVLCYSVTDRYQIYWNASCHWKKYALPSGRQLITKLGMLLIFRLLPL